MTVKTDKTPRYRETPELTGAARRMVRAVGKRCATDVDALAELVELRAEIDRQLVEAVAAARSGESLAAGTPGYSWADVGRVLGMTRQAAQQRFGKGVAA